MSELKHLMLDAIDSFYFVPASESKEAMFEAAKLECIGNIKNELAKVEQITFEDFKKFKGW